MNALRKALTGTAVAAGLTAAVLATAAPASALADAAVVAYGDDSYFATCGVFDEMFTGNVRNDTQVALGVASAVMDAYMISGDGAVQVINYQVANYCPRHWDNLTAIGNAARAS